MCPEGKADSSKQVPGKQPLEREKRPAEAVPGSQVLDERLSALIRPNDVLLVPPYNKALGAYKPSPSYNYRHKLVLAELLELIAERLSPADRSNVESGRLMDESKKLEKAIRLGIGQMLERLRPMERVAHQLILWRQNYTSGTASENLPENQTSIIVGPNLLENLGFQKVIFNELRQTNWTFGRDAYRSLLLLPFEEFPRGAERETLLEYLRCADQFNTHIVGSVPVSNSERDVEVVSKRWKFLKSDFPKKEEYTLPSQASIVLNHLKVRNPNKKYYESDPLTLGLHYAYAGHVVRYIHSPKEPQWEHPIAISPQKGVRYNECMTNFMGRRDTAARCVGNRCNFIYLAGTEESKEEAGLRILSDTTMMPKLRSDLKSYLLQSQARYTRNRIQFYVETFLSRSVGGTMTDEQKSSIEKTVTEYLRSLQATRQIESFTPPVCQEKAGETGKYFVKFGISWLETAEAFDFLIENQDRKGEPKAAAS